MHIAYRNISERRSLARGLRELAIIIAVLACIAIIARGQSAPQSAAALMNDVVANELADRAQQRKFIYLIDKRDGKQTLTVEQVDTIDGPLFRVLAINGAPLNPGQRQQDNARMDRLMHNSAEQLKAKVEHEDDELTLMKVLRLLPDAFIFDYDGNEGTLVRLKFHPNTNFNPPTYEARVVHALAGIVLIDPQAKRLAKFSGQLTDRVEFAYGLLGHIDKGGTIEIGRTQIEAQEWKTNMVNIQLSGRLVFFKTISKQEYETRSSFRLVSADLGLIAASQLLAR